MKTMPSSFVRCAAIALVGLAAGGAAHAQSSTVSLTLTNNTISTTAGSTVTFFGKATNNPGAATVFLNNANLSQVDPALTADYTMADYFNATPIMLTGGQSYPASGTASFFTVMVAQSTAPGTYSGQFSLLGGADMNAQDTLVTQTFSVTVTPAAAPEPSQLASLAVGVLGLAALGLKARKRTASAQA